MKVHVFPFSPREGTVAYKYTDKILNSVKAQRCAILQKECDRIREDILNSYIGKTVNVLFEAPKDNTIQGYTENYTYVSCKGCTSLCGEIHKVLITKASNEECFGEIKQ